jgi:hypothetical protein
VIAGPKTLQEARCGRAGEKMTKKQGKTAFFSSMFTSSPVDSRANF